MSPIQRHTNYGINKIVPKKQNEIVISSVDERIDTILQSYRDTGPKNTLIIIGNGFDLWQGLKTDYNSFKEYYLSHRKEIERSLGMKIDKDISDVEQIYGNPLSRDELPDIFWNSFESSLGNIDAERIFLSFDKSRNGIREIRNVIKNGSRILHRAIIDWVSTIEIEPCETEYNFRNNCIFINFNYTDTLVKRFHVNSENIFHIHGSAQNPKLIRMGHSKHPQTPEPGLDSFGIRFRELHLVEQLLYDTDKQVKDNIQYLSLFLIMKNISLDDITDIYVLGHSFGNVDIDYFRYLYVKTKTIATDSINDMAKRDIEGEEKINQLTSSEDEQQWKRINYIIHRYGYSENAIMRGDRPSEEEMREYYEAIVRKHTEEQNVRDKIITDIFIRKYLDDIRNNEKPHVPKSENALPSRQKSVRWHVSCYTDDDKKQVRNFFDSVGCTSYDVFDSIDECIETFRK